MIILITKSETKSDIVFENLLMLAPLAGYTDLPFRSVVKRFGVDITVSEMTSAHALVFNPKKTLPLIAKSANETPYSVQIAGSKKDIITKAVEILNTQQGIDIIDLNCGCPAPKVANHGNGSGLLQNLQLLVEIANLIKEKSNKKYVSLKLRLGFDKKIPLEIANALNDTNVDFVVIHGRTRMDKYKAERIDYDSIALIRRHIAIPLIANGEIKSPKDARRVMDICGAQGVMIGRAAVSAPWIFWQIKHNTDELPPIVKRDIVLEHFDKMIESYGERGAIIFRKNCHAYSKGERNASEFRTIINSTTTPSQMREAIERFFSK